MYKYGFFPSPVAMFISASFLSISRSILQHRCNQHYKPGQARKWVCSWVSNITCNSLIFFLNGQTKPELSNKLL